MPRRGSSGHHFSMSGHQEAFHGYCVCCSNYRRLQTYFDGQYYCTTCRRKITAGLRKARLLPEQVTTDQQKVEMAAKIEELAKQIQMTMAGETKITEWDKKMKWKPQRKKPME